MQWSIGKSQKMDTIMEEFSGKSESKGDVMVAAVTAVNLDKEK